MTLVHLDDAANECYRVGWDDSRGNHDSSGTVLQCCRRSCMRFSSPRMPAAPSSRASACQAAGRRPTFANTWVWRAGEPAISKL